MGKIFVLAVLAIFIAAGFNTGSFNFINDSKNLNNHELDISNFSVYYGSIVNQSLINELSQYDLVILQHWAFSEQNLSQIKSIKIAYMDLGEYDNSTYPNCTVNLTGIVIGNDTQWDQPIVNVSSPEWLNYTICRVKYDLSLGFNGVMFDDLDIVEQYPWEASGMVKIISTIHTDFPGIIIGINRGFELIDSLSAYVNFVVYEDFGTYYNLTANSYQFLNRTGISEINNITENIKSLGLPVLGLGYAPQNCDYYASFDSQLGKELGVPVYTGNWNLSELYMPCSYTYYIFQELKSYRSILTAQANYIMSAQLNDGAIETSPSSNYILPYTSNLASVGLIRAYELTGNTTYINGALKWLDWYSSHQNKNRDNEGIVGTVYDYEVVNGSEFPTYNYDSSDSYAATYITAMYDYIHATDNLSYLNASEPSIFLALKAIFSTMNDNLTFAKPDYRVKYLMDNCEVYQGLISAERLMRYLGNYSYASKLMEIADNVNKNIISDFLVNEYYFDYAIGAQMNFSEYYPDIMANYWPVIMNVIGWNSTIANNVFNFLLNQSYYENAINCSMVDMSSAYYSSLMGESNITQMIVSLASSIPQNNSSWDVEESSWMIQSFFIFNPENGTIVDNYSVNLRNDSIFVNISFTGNNNGTIALLLPSGMHYFSRSTSITVSEGMDQYLIFNTSKNGTISLYFSCLNFENLYSVEFNEKNLPDNTIWSVMLGNNTRSSNNETIVFYEPAGTYYFYVLSNGGYVPKISAGQIIINNQNVSLTIVFSHENYSVTFVERGLMPGTIWYVNLSNGQSFLSRNNTISFFEPNGSYSYKLGYPDSYSTSEKNGTIIITGQNITRSIIFANSTSSNNNLIFSSTILLEGSLLVFLAIILIFAVLKTFKKSKK